MGSSPSRRCIICRKAASKLELARFVLKGAMLECDAGESSTGRGAYVHRNVACLARASDRQRWAHALRVDPKCALDIRAIERLKEEVVAALALARDGAEQKQVSKTDSE